MSRRRVASVGAGARIGAAVAVALLAMPSPAAAHLRTGAVAVDYTVTLSTPSAAAFRAQIYQSDRGLRLTVHRGHVVILLGYLGEPVFRLDSAGLWVNAASPTAAVDGLERKGQQVQGSGPVWRLSRGRRSAAWHDARVQALPSGVNRGPWSVPLVVDDRQVSLRGELLRAPATPLWPWLALLAVLLAGGAAPLWRRRSLSRAWTAGFSLTASAAVAVLAVSFGLDAYASPGTWIEGVDEVAFLAVGLGVLFRGPAEWQHGGAIGIGLVALAAGLMKGAVFFHPIVLAITPGAVTRLLVLAAIGCGLVATALGCASYLEPRRPARGIATDPRLVTAARRLG